jgi:hypothetical protein
METGKEAEKEYPLMWAMGAEEVLYENVVINGRIPAYRFRDNLK